MTAVLVVMLSALLLASANAQTIGLLSNKTTVSTGQPVTLTAIASPGVTGRVAFLDGAEILGSAALVNSQAALTLRFSSSGKR